MKLKFTNLLIAGILASAAQITPAYAAIVPLTLNNYTVPIIMSAPAADTSTPIAFLVGFDTLSAPKLAIWICASWPNFSKPYNWVHPMMSPKSWVNNS